MILLELVDTNSGRTVMEGLNRRPLYKELREKYGRIPKEAIKSGDWIIRPQENGLTAAICRHFREWSLLPDDLRGRLQSPISRIRNAQ